MPGIVLSFELVQHIEYHPHTLLNMSHKLTEDNQRCFYLESIFWVILCLCYFPSSFCCDRCVSLWCSSRFNAEKGDQLLRRSPCNNGWMNAHWPEAPESQRCNHLLSHSMCRSDHVYLLISIIDIDSCTVSRFVGDSLTWKIELCSRGQTGMRWIEESAVVPFMEL